MTILCGCCFQTKPYFYTYKNSDSGSLDGTYSNAQGEANDGKVQYVAAKEPQQDGNTGSAGSSVTVLVLVASLAIVSMVVLFVVMRKRKLRSQSRGIREIMVWPRNLSGYAEI